MKFVESRLKMPLMELPVRSVLVETKGAGAVFFSPGSKISQTQFDELGHVTDLVAPNFFHCGGIKKSAARFRDAKKWGPPGVTAARPDIAWSAELTEETWSYQDELPLIFLEGAPKLNEVVFVHRPSKSLIVSDLCFNLVDSEGIGAWLILTLFGTYRKFGVSRLLAQVVRDRGLFEKSLQKLLSYDFDNIIVSHGHNVMGNGKALLQRALQDRGLLRASTG